eukprot:2644936-Amphidinium_carterae.1
MSPPCGRSETASPRVGWAYCATGLRWTSHHCIDLLRPLTGIAPQQEHSIAAYDCEEEKHDN